MTETYSLQDPLQKNCAMHKHVHRNYTALITDNLLERLALELVKFYTRRFLVLKETSGKQLLLKFIERDLCPSSDGFYPHPFSRGCKYVFVFISYQTQTVNNKYSSEMPRSQSLGSHFTIKESVQIPQDSKTISVGDLTPKTHCP